MQCIKLYKFFFPQKTYHAQTISYLVLGNKT